MRRRRVYNVALLAGMLGCADTTSPDTEASPEPTAVTTTALQAAAQESDEISEPAILVHWRERAAERKNARGIDVVVENTSDYALQVELSVVAVDDGEAITRSFGRRSLNAHSSQDVSVPIALIPVQTAGADTAVC